MVDQIKSPLLFCLLLTCLSLFACERTFRNFDGKLPEQEFARVSGHGLRIYLIGAERNYFDSLHLTPGDYLIGFRQVGSRMSGVARCLLEGGQSYELFVSGRRFLKKSKSWILEGSCRSLPPEN